MTYEEKISWLSRYREAEKLYQRLSYRLAEAQEATRHITQIGRASCRERV